MSATYIPKRFLKIANRFVTFENIIYVEKQEFEGGAFRLAVRLIDGTTFIVDEDEKEALLAYLEDRSAIPKK